MSTQITYDSTYNGLSINTNADKGLGCRTDVLDKLVAHQDDMVNKHSKVMQVRFDLRYPDDGSVTPQAQHLHVFNYNLQRKLKREKHVGGHLVDPRLTTVTEQHENSERPHIHAVLLVNANAKQSYYPIVETAEQLWATAIQSNSPGLVDYCDKNGRNGMIIKRNSEDYEKQMNEVSRQASYLAKTRGKDTRPKGAWPVSGTRVPK